MSVFNVGDIVESVFWMGRGYEGEKLIRTGPYRIISFGFFEGEISYFDEMNETENPYIPPANYNFLVVPVEIPIGKERASDWCHLNHYLPSMHPNIMRGAYIGDGDYLIRRGVAAGAQTSLF